MKKEIKEKIKTLPNGLARAIMREILREKNMSYGKVDSILN